MAFASEAYGNELCAGEFLPWHAAAAVQNASSWAFCASQCQCSALTSFIAGGDQVENRERSHIRNADLTHSWGRSLLRIGTVPLMCACMWLGSVPICVRPVPGMSRCPLVDCPRHVVPGMSHRIYRPGEKLYALGDCPRYVLGDCPRYVHPASCQGTTLLHQKRSRSTLYLSPVCPSPVCPSHLSHSCNCPEDTTVRANHR